MLGSRNILTSRKLTLMALASCIGIVTFADFVSSSLRASARTDASLRKVQTVAQRSIHVLKLYPKTVTPPLEFHGLKHNNKPLDFGAVFEDGGDFFERVSFDVTSRADKKAVYIEIMVYFYTQAGVKEKKPQTVFQLFYGRHPLLTMQPPSTFSLNPGETLTVSIPASSVSLLRERLSRVEGEIARIGIYTMQVGYVDGTRWNFDGQNLPARNRTSMLRRPAETETEHSFVFVGDALADQISMRSSYTYELPFLFTRNRSLFNSQEFGQCYNTQGDEPYLCVVSPSCYHEFRQKEGRIALP
ncbi:MAG: hypothetical protein SF339_22940 [Blastocatellia bacterium]|nr:hypothetical protein [Blastocatellia bacterium]